MAEYWKNLNLFKPGTDDNIGVEDSLNGNFQKIDQKLGDALTDKNSKVYTSLGERLNSNLTDLEKVKSVTDSITGISDNAILGNREFMVIAHRGMPEIAPENTLPSFMWAINNGYWGVSCDLQRSQDGVWVLINDLTVDRTSTGNGNVADKTFAQLRALDFGSKFSGLYKNTLIPSLDEFLELCRIGKAVPIIRIKGVYAVEHLKEVVTILQKWNMEKDCAVTSVELSNLQQLRFLSPLLALGWASSTFTQLTVDGAVALHNSFLYIQSSAVTEASMTLAKTANVPVFGYECESHTEMRRLAALGVSGIASRTIINRRGM